MISSSIHRVCVYLTMLAGLLLAGCSSKPSDGDIERHFVAALRCSPFKLLSVKKTDGAPVEGGMYDVAFTYQLEFKAGKDGAADFMAKLMAAEQRAAEGQKALGAYWTRGEQGERDNAAVAKLKADSLALTLGGCSVTETGQDEVAALSVLAAFHDVIAERLKTGSGQISVPYEATKSGSGRMRKAESGWHFVNSPNGQIIEVKETAPTTFARPAPAAPVAVVTTDTRTLVGVLDHALTTSCFNVRPSAGDEVCYAFNSRGAEMQAIMDACGKSERCEITGRFDDAKQQLISVGSARPAP